MNEVKSEHLVDEVASPSQQAQQRLIDLLARHPDLVEGRLEQVADEFCREAAQALGAQNVGLWQLDARGDRLVGVASNRGGFADVSGFQKGELHRDDAPVFFAALERQRVLEGGSLEGFEGLAGSAARGLALSVLVEGHAWGVLSFTRPKRGVWDSHDYTTAALLAEMVGRCVERSNAEAAQVDARRARASLSAFARMMGEALCFEVVAGKLLTLGDARRVLGNPASSGSYEVDHLLAHIRSEEQEVLQRRYQDWLDAGSPGVLSARFHYSPNRLSSGANARQEIELSCRLMRLRDEDGKHLLGILQML